jgi:hypothetical protein
MFGAGTLAASASLVITLTLVITRACVPTAAITVASRAGTELAGAPWATTHSTAHDAGHGCHSRAVATSDAPLQRTMGHVRTAAKGAAAQPRAVLAPGLTYPAVTNAEQQPSVARRAVHLDRLLSDRVEQLKAVPGDSTRVICVPTTALVRRPQDACSANNATGRWASAVGLWGTGGRGRLETARTTKTMDLRDAPAANRDHRQRYPRVQFRAFLHSSLLGRGVVPLLSQVVRATTSPSPATGALTGGVCTRGLAL